jgi:hypothetical protein
VTLGVVVHRHGSRTVREERPRAPGFEAVNMRDFDRKGRGTRGRRKGWKRRLAARHLLWRLRNEPRYSKPIRGPAGWAREAGLWTTTRRREP